MNVKLIDKEKPTSSKRILFTKEEISQHEKEFFAYWEDVLRKENLTVEVKKIAKGWRFLWQGCQIGQVGFKQRGHWIQWFEGAYVIDWKTALKKNDDEQERYFRDASGKLMEADDLDLQECIDKIPYWLQYARVLIERKEKRQRA